MTVPMWVDVPAGKTVPILTEVALPETAGTYSLEFGLVQDAMSLTSCGLTPARLEMKVARAR